MIALAIIGTFLWTQMLLQTPLGSVVEAAMSRPAEVHAALPERTVGLPVRISIPSIGLTAAIEQVTLTKAGAMDVPKDPMHAGWYALGPRPGETGSAAIDGHVNWWHGQTAVFTNLSQLKRGDTITTQDENGTVTTFAVRTIQTFDAGADAAQVFTSTDGKAHLNIITCEGLWSKRLQQYTERLVVFADQVQN